MHADRYAWFAFGWPNLKHPCLEEFTGSWKLLPAQPCARGACGVDAGGRKAVLLFVDSPATGCLTISWVMFPWKKHEKTGTNMKNNETHGKYYGKYEKKTWDFLKHDGAGWKNVKHDMSTCSFNLVIFFNSPAARGHVRHGPLWGIPYITSLQWPMRPWVPWLLRVPKGFHMLKMDENWDATTKNHQKLYFEHVLSVSRRGFHQQNPIAMQAVGVPCFFSTFVFFHICFLWIIPDNRHYWSVELSHECLPPWGSSRGRQISSRGLWVCVSMWAVAARYLCWLMILGDYTTQ